MSRVYYYGVYVWPVLFLNCWICGIVSYINLTVLFIAREGSNICLHELCVSYLPNGYFFVTMLIA